MSDEARYRVLEALCRRVRENDEVRKHNSSDLKDEITSSSDTEEEDVEYGINRLSDQGLVDGHGGVNYTVELRARGIDKFERLSGEEVISQQRQGDILNTLYETEQDTPSSPGKSREALLDDIDMSEGELDTTVWYLREQRLIETVDGMGQEFFEAQITERGRQRVE